MNRLPDQSIDKSVLSTWIEWSDWECRISRVARQPELLQASVGVTRRNDGVRGDDALQGVEMGVVEDNLELRGPFAGQPNMARFIESVGQAPRWGCRAHFDDLPNIGSAQRYRVADGRPVRASPSKRGGQAAAKTLVEQLGQTTGDRNGGDVIDCQGIDQGGAQRGAPGGVCASVEAMARTGRWPR